MWYSYAILRVVPRVEREEFINTGVILFVRENGFIKARTYLDSDVLKALDPNADCEQIERRLLVCEQIAAGDPAGGVLSQYPPPERFHWLTTPRSTVIQPSPVRTGCTADPESELNRLFESLVRRRSGN